MSEQAKFEDILPINSTEIITNTDFRPLSLVPKIKNPIELISKENIKSKFDKLEKQTPELLLITILESIHIMPTELEVENKEKRDNLLSEIFSASSDLSDYYKTCDEKGLKRSTATRVLIIKSEIYEDTPILQTIEALLPNHDSQLFYRYKNDLIEANRIARIALILENSDI